MGVSGPVTAHIDPSHSSFTASGVKNEGWFDPWMLLNAFKKKVKSMGVEFLEADVTGVNVAENRVEGVKVKKTAGGFILS